MPQLVQIIFSWDRPLQLWGLVKSLLDNTDLKPKQIRVLCKCSNAKYQKAYQTVNKELGCQIVYQNNRPLWNMIQEQIQGNEYVSFAVDGMMFFRKASYSEVIKIMQKEPEICIWSWCLGPDLQPSNKLILHAGYWTAPHATAGMPFSYIFHENGSLFRKNDFEYWIHLLPKQHRIKFNLNLIESYLVKLPKSVRRSLGRLHAGPLVQASVAWRVNKVVGPSYGSPYYATNQTKPEYLMKIFERGGRLDYSPLYGRTDWLQNLDANWPHFAFVSHSKEAANFFTKLIKI